jgi:hypothetical protein
MCCVNTKQYAATLKQTFTQNAGQQHATTVASSAQHSYVAVLSW